MTDYAPAERRPIADAFRRVAHSSVDFCVSHHVHPNTISYLSMVFAAGAALCLFTAQFWLPSWPLAVLLIVGRLYCNMLDGMVALASKKASPVGEIANEFPDRVSDCLIFVGLAHSGFCNPFLAYWSAILAMFVAYTGVLGKAVGAKREFCGAMSKPWRMVAVIAGCIAMFLTTLIGSSMNLPTFNVMDVVCGFVVVGSVATVWQRLRRITQQLTSLSEKDA